MKRIVSLILVFVFLWLLCACARHSGTRQEPSGDVSVSEGGDTPGEEWALPENYTAGVTSSEDNFRVFYEIFVGSFSDSDGDGVGDLRGIIERMDYLNDGDERSGKSLMVEGIWLTPIFKSPSYHKYDVTDYYTIDEKFGTQEDLAELLSLCHARNVKVIMDLPINHTGYMNEWFGKFVTAHRQGRTDDPYYHYYSFYSSPDSPPAGRSFSQVSGTTDYYECNFSGDMPELDFDNEDVRREVLKIAEHYLDLGVDGFRFDAAKYIYYGDHDANVAFWKDYVGELEKIKPDLYTVAEVWDGDGVTDRYYPALNCFDFTCSGSAGLISNTAKAGDVNAYVGYVDRYLDSVEKLREGAMMLPFVSNHDMDRAAGYLTAASGAARVAANLYILTKGSPFIYYGEEIGMRGSRGGEATDANRRLAMVWGDGDTVKDPNGSNYIGKNEINTVAASDQKADENSLYSYYKKLIAIRRANPEISRGDYEALKFDSKAGGFISTYEGSSVCVLHNTTGRTITLKLSDATDRKFTVLAAVIGVTPEEAKTSFDGDTVVLDPQTSVVLR